MERHETDLRPSSSRTSINVKIPSNVQEADLLCHKHKAEAKKTVSKNITADFQQNTNGTQKAKTMHKSIVSLIEAHTLHPGTQHISVESYQTAVSVIERAWISFRNKQIFRLLKHSVCAAESSLSCDILRKVIPREAELLNDKSQQVKVRFRFGGEEFPPLIFFKIFIDGAAQKVKYMSGKKIIRPATEAAEDSLRQMGNRTFNDQILKDILWQQQSSITDEIDVTTLKDYMQYLANLDERPAWQGGKENYWRKLTLDVLPRRTIFFDVVDFAYNNRMTPRLKEEMHILMSQPITQEVQIRQIQAISKMRTQVYPNTPPSAPSKSKVSGTRSHSQVSSRRSKQARLKALKMRDLYSRESTGELSRNTDDNIYSGLSEDDAVTSEDDAVTSEDDEEYELDKEANKLYEWTQELSFHDDPW